MFVRLLVGLALQLLSSLLYKPPPGPEAAQFKDFSIPQANDGDRFTDFAGTLWVSDAVVAWAGDFDSNGIYKKRKKS
jgi:hypothetical protein